VVDDGIATGSTARAACRVARVHGAARVVLAVPVAPAGVAAVLAGVADEVVCLQEPSWFGAVGQFYDDFTPTTDDEVRALLDHAARTAVATAIADDPPGLDTDVTIDIGAYGWPVA
jgi:putative phosphoribosyl transferase